MSRVNANGIQIEYETFGNTSSRPLLLIIGLGGQVNQWDEDLCRDLAERGYYVIRFDNRDVGLSTKFEEAGEPDLMDIFGKLMKGEKIKSPYIGPGSGLYCWTFSYGIWGTQYRYRFPDGIPNARGSKSRCK